MAVRRQQRGNQVGGGSRTGNLRKMSGPRNQSSRGGKGQTTAGSTDKCTVAQKEIRDGLKPIGYQNNLWLKGGWGRLMQTLRGTKQSKLNPWGGKNSRPRIEKGKKAAKRKIVEKEKYKGDTVG